VSVREHPLFGTALPGDWALHSVDDIKAPEKSSCVAGPFGSNISSKYFVPQGVPVIRGSNLRDDLTPFVPEGFVFVSADRAKEYPAQHVRGGDLVFTCWGTVGQVGLIPDHGPFPEYIISNKQLKLRPDPTRAHSRYLFYYFACPAMVQHVRSRAIGAAVPGINLGILKALPVVLPPLAAQRRIVEVLGTYDDLIDNCERRIRVLDEMARALYREWFVDFRYPGHEKTPLVDSPMGRIPKGWQAATTGRVARETRRGVAKGALADGPVRYVGLEHIPRRQLALDAWVETDDLGSNKLRFARGEILFGKIRPYFHKVSVAPFAGVCSADTFVISPTQPAFGAFVACLVSSDEFVAHASATANGAKMPRANWDVMVEFPVAVPPPALLDRFSAIVDPLVQGQGSLVFQATNLRKTRDLVLPRLLSGQVSVEDVT
jgi:type I restriction enzyme S subunit